MPLLPLLAPLVASAALAAPPPTAVTDGSRPAPRIDAPSTVDPRSGEVRPPVRYQRWISRLSQFWYFPDEDATPLQQRGQRIYGRVLVRVIGHCTFTSYVPRPTRREPTVLLQLAVPVLNRAPTPADRPLPEMREIQGLYLEWTRRIATPDGRQLMVVAAIDRGQETLPTRCMRRIHARLERALEGEPVAVRRAALRSHRARRARHPPRLGPPVETVSLLDLDVADDDGYETIAHAELPRLLRGDAFGTTTARDPARALVGGIVPDDDVERVTLTLGRREWDRRAYPPEPLPLRVTLPVHEGVVATEVERPYDDAQVLDVVLHHRPDVSLHPEIRVVR